MSATSDVRAVALALPRAYETVVDDRVKFRVGRLVFLALSRDESLLGFACPRDEREALVQSNPGVYLMPLDQDLRYNWARLRLARVEPVELAEIIVDAWRLVVPQKLSRVAPDPSTLVRAAR